MDSKLNAVDRIKVCLANGCHFVLQGGAGSGKTETLKEILSYIHATTPEKHVACITLTNKAADEIKNRVKSNYHISTIHSFLHGIIGRYQRNIQSILAEIYFLKPLMSPTGDAQDVEHKYYKDAYNKYTRARYRFSEIKSSKVTGKREFDKDPGRYVLELAAMVDELNLEIAAHVKNSDFRIIKYNESPFDNVKALTFGHDGLLKVAVALLMKYPTLQRILNDKFDFIFIDEYQDTSPDIVRVLLDVVSKNCQVTFGFFGDSMQGIYKGGVGDVESYVASGLLSKIEKEDNFRCSQQVVRFLNKLRLDTLTQEVAFKVDINGKKEQLAQRQGTVRCFYAVPPGDAKDDKENYIAKLKSLISKANPNSDAKILMLTNKSIASEVGFPELYGVFNERYGQDAAEKMKRVSGILQLDELLNLCILFSQAKYNEVISLVKRSGFSLRSQKDKLELRNKLQSICDSKKSMISTLMDGYQAGLIKQSGASENYIKNKDQFLVDLVADTVFQTFVRDMQAGTNTAIKMADAGREMDSYLFDDLQRLLNKKNFYDALFSDKIDFSEVVNYVEYLNDKKHYVTMHKTKGTGIENVVVVLNEYFWNEYNFKNILTERNEDQVMDRKLVYVACSRAITNLSCVRLVSEEEETAFVAAGFDEINKFDFHAL
jgi:DNA helicase-2/ATP-dependent DNA helicase PcrA